MVVERLFAFALALLLAVGAVAIHFEGLNVLSRFMRYRGGAHRLLLSAIICGIIVIHIVETMLFALGFWFGAEYLHLGHFVGTHEPSAIFYFYFSAETFTTQSLGDVYPVGALRMIASIEPLTGLILIGWSTSFTFLLMGRYWNGRRRG